ncbi:MAG: DnaA regulatory inactivator Hda [Burkholderiales bacterium]|nr:DnaA regulatory inactivator Hda [Burkholderiales bacterium]
MSPTRQIPLPLAPAAAHGFDDFVPGANAAALAQLRALDRAGAPVYLWGPSGSGKTHLLQALRDAACAQGWHVQELAGSAAAGARDADEAPALVLIDDCDALDAAAQADAFRAFVEAAARGGRVVAAGRLPPVDLPLREDLRTRLGWGLVFALQPLAEGDLVSALRREASRRGLALPDELVQHLMTRFARDLKSLMQVLQRLDQYALARARRPTVPLLRAMLQEEGGAC